MKDKMLETERLLLQLSSGGLAGQVHAFVKSNRQFLAQWEPKRNEEYYTLAHQMAELCRDQQAHKKGEAARFWLVPKAAPGTVIGSAAVSNIVMGAFCSAFLGYKLGAQHQGQGYMAEALLAICNFAFCGIGLHRLEANIMPRNKASLAVVQKLGFENEGLAKKYLQINGVWEDHLHMVLLNNRAQSLPN